jgi:hypothetical protein
LLPGMLRAEGSLPFRGCRITFAFSQDRRVEKPRFQVDFRPVETDGDAVLIPFSGRDMHVTATVPAA